MSLTIFDAHAVGLSAQRLQHLVAVLGREHERRILPGAVAVVLRHGQVVLHAAVGQVNPARGLAMSTAARFRIYSMTKPIVSVAAMMLVEDGLLQLADPLARHLPEFAQPQVAYQEGGEWTYRPAQRAITVHDLLRHTAGLTYEFLGSSPVQRQYTQLRVGGRDRPLADFARQLAALPLVAEPGSAFEYSRATDVLGRVIEVVSGQPLAEFLAERVFAPLRMLNTGFVVPPQDHDAIAEPYARDPDGGLQMKVIDVRQPAALASGGGGLVSTAADYTRFVQMLMGGGSFEGQRLLGPQTLAFMTTDHVLDRPVFSPGSRGLLPEGHGFGLGFAVRLRAGACPVPGSVGTYFWGGLAGTTFFVDPVLQLAGILMLQAPNQRERYRMLFRNLVYAAVAD